MWPAHNWQKMHQEKRDHDERAAVDLEGEGEEGDCLASISIGLNSIAKLNVEGGYGTVR